MSGEIEFKLDQSGQLDVEFYFGQANWGMYQLALYDSAGVLLQSLLAGVNSDNIPDTTTVNTVGASGKYLYSALRTARFDSSPSGDYYMEIILKQNGVATPFVYQGKFAQHVQDAICLVKLVGGI